MLCPLPCPSVPSSLCPFGTFVPLPLGLTLFPTEVPRWPISRPFRSRLKAQAFSISFSASTGKPGAPARPATASASRAKQSPRCRRLNATPEGKVHTATLFPARPQGRPDPRSLPRLARSAQPGRARPGPDPVLRLPHPRALLRLGGRAGPLRVHAARPTRPPQPKALSRTRRSGTPTWPSR